MFEFSRLYHLEHVVFKRHDSHMDIVSHSHIDSVTFFTKNIPLSPQNDYLQRLIEKTEQFLHRMCWKAYLFLPTSRLIDPTKPKIGVISNPITECK